MSSRATSPNFTIQHPTDVPPPHRRWMLWTALAVVVLGAAGAGAWYWTHRLPPVESVSVNTFTGGDDWLGKGISGEVADLLSQAQGIRSAPNDPSMAAALDATVERAPDRIVVNAELYRAADHHRYW